VLVSEPDGGTRNKYESLAKVEQQFKTECPSNHGICITYLTQGIVEKNATEKEAKIIHMNPQPEH
jgi:hypothetical protein